MIGFDGMLKIMQIAKDTTHSEEDINFVEDILSGLWWKWMMKKRHWRPVNKYEKEDFPCSVVFLDKFNYEEKLDWLEKQWRNIFPYEHFNRGLFEPFEF